MSQDVKSLALADSLRKVGCEVKQDFRIDGRYYLFAAHRMRVGMIVFIPVLFHEYFLASFTSQLTQDKLLKRLANAGTFAFCSHFHSPSWKQRLAAYIPVYYVFLCERVTSECIEFVRKTPPRHFSGIWKVPIVHDLASSETHFFERCPIVSNAVYRSIRRVIKKQIAPPLSIQASTTMRSDAVE